MPPRRKYCFRCKRPSQILSSCGPAFIAYLEITKDPAEVAEQLYFQLNTNQHQCFKQVLAAIKSSKPAEFFLQGPSGTGKIFLYQALFYYRPEARLFCVLYSLELCLYCCPTAVQPI
ncbi:hypothetical protein BJX63DRAFT_397314 [Aspergillus granulosus]|uniref:ATP-dependent DNA helicase n=1 Tax=Aspergillus granulosus TaxID=176169 RepID=A0ABR4H9E0_9EURO